MGMRSGVVMVVGVVCGAMGAVTQPSVTSSPEFDPRRTLVVDAVRLVGGQEVAGRPDLAVTRGVFKYWFADESGVAAFEGDPERYEIQFNGACARMGPLSSGGDARRWWVHEARIYVFASESCRETFSKHAERLLERDDRSIVPAGCEEADGRALLELAVGWVGGAEALERVETVARRRVVAFADANTRMDHHLILAIEFGSSGEAERVFRRDDWHQYGAWGEAVEGAASWSFARDGAEGPTTWTPLVASQHRSLQREIGTELIVALRGALAGAATVCRVGAGELDGTPVEWVAIHRDGITVRLGIEPDTGRIGGMAFTARGGAHGFVGTRELRFSRFVEAGGVRWPAEATAWFNGERDDGADLSGVTIEVNEPMDEGWFEGAPVTG